MAAKEPPVKKTKYTHEESSLSGAAAGFRTGLLQDNLELSEKYRNAKPWHYGVIEELCDPELLENVQSEIVRELHFTEKETDIYKVFQTGDLASLSYLSQTELSRLSSLFTLRNHLYSLEFRNFLRKVTGCGPLSGKKQDMSVNSYKRGCHLLNHDDVIGTRRVSYILYMPIGPKNSKHWKSEWGGSLEIYPVRSSRGVLVPETAPSVVIPPSWNQFIFFEVQPGYSFHSVEEVVVGDDQDGMQRLSISGWFHAAQSDEPDYDSAYETEKDATQSSLQQLSEGPQIPLNPLDFDLSSGTIFSTEEKELLARFLHPVYLQDVTIDKLSQKFTEDSHLALRSFLKPDCAAPLQRSLAQADQIDLPRSSGVAKIPGHNSCAAEGDWIVRGPPHKHRYCTIDSDAPTITFESSSISDLNSVLLPSKAFAKWLKRVTTMAPTTRSTEVRRFRPGLDYTLAQACEAEPRLDVILGLTPSANDSQAAQTWLSGTCGGWDCYMAPHDGDDDPAVYRSGRKSTAKELNVEPPIPDTVRTQADRQSDVVRSAQPERGEDDEEEDESALLTVHAQWNTLLIVLRDPGVMRFVKYLSAWAPGSRFDICAEFGVEDGEEDE